MAFDNPLQWIIIGIIVVVIFLWGPQKIPQLARALGRARKEFDQASKNFESASLGEDTPEAPGASRSADEVLMDTARQLGISTEGKTREQISKEIVAKSKPQS